MISLLFLLLSCVKATDQPIDFTIDITSPTYSNLQNYGGFTYYNDLILIRDAYGNFYALSKYCTVDLTNLIYYPSYGFLQCPNDQTEYTLSGAILTPRSGASPLTSYHTSINGNYLRVYSGR